MIGLFAALLVLLAAGLSEVVASRFWRSSGALGISRGAVKSHASRGLATLEAELDGSA